VNRVDLVLVCNSTAVPAPTQLSSILPLPNTTRSRLLQILKPKILHRIHRHQIPLHPTLQIPLTQLSAFIVVDSLVAADAAEVLFHDVLAFGVVVEGEGAAFRWDGFGEFLGAAWGAGGGHCFAVGGWKMAVREGQLAVVE
jgi:hypothetical protein